LLVRWLFGPSVRPFLGLVLLLGLRQIMQAICALPAPPNMIWHYPGFPSLLVTYNVGNDFFFSGHTAIAVFGGIELEHQSAEQELITAPNRRGYAVVVRGIDLLAPPRVAVGRIQ